MIRHHFGDVRAHASSASGKSRRARSLRGNRIFFPASAAESSCGQCHAQKFLRDVIDGKPLGGHRAGRCGADRGALIGGIPAGLNSSLRQRAAKKRTALALVNKIQSKSRQRDVSRDPGRRYPAARKNSPRETADTVAPIDSSRDFKPRACSTARVTTMRFPCSVPGMLMRASCGFRSPAEPSAPPSRNFSAIRLPKRLRRLRRIPNLFPHKRCVPSGDSTATSSTQLSAFEAPPRSDGNLATASESGKRGAFRGHRAASFGVVQFRESLQRRSIVRARLDSDRALPGGRQA